MLSEELIELANKINKQKAESQTLEVKAAHQGCPRRLYDTLSAFSNQDSGGVILFGLDESENFETVGVYDLQDLQKKVTEQCNQMIPPVRAVFTAAELDGKYLCAAEIPSVDITERPCYYSGSGRSKGAYIRVGDADLPMTDYEIYNYEAFRRHQHDDERTVERADMALLDGDQLQDYLMRMRRERPGFSKLSTEEAYEMLAVTRDGKPTLAAILNFALYPQGYFPQLAITAVVVPGREIGDTGACSARFLNNKRIEGTLQMMLDESITFCLRNMKIRTVIDSNTGERRDIPEYPVEAIREAVLNALIHRDYSHFTEGTPVQINFFTDRLEIRSPGGLYGRMTVEDLGKAGPDLRNPALAAMSEFLLHTENRYSGIPTIRREMAALGLPEPVFLNQRNEFIVILYNSTGKVQPARTARGLNRSNDADPETQTAHCAGIHARDEKLLNYCRTPRSRQEIADFLGISTIYYVTRHYIQPLLETGKLKMTIPEKPKSRNQKYFCTPGSRD